MSAFTSCFVRETTLPLIQMRKMLLKQRMYERIAASVPSQKEQIGSILKKNVDSSWRVASSREQYSQQVMLRDCVPIHQ